MIGLIAYKIDLPPPSPKKGLDLDWQDEHGDTALSIVAQRCHGAACALLLERGASLKVINREGFAPLHVIARLRLETLDAPALADVLATASLLLEARADPTQLTRARTEYTSGSWARRAPDGSTTPLSNLGTSCLHLAVEASGGRTDLLELLLVAGAPVDARTGDASATPFHLALDAGFTDVAAALVRHGADVNLGNSDIGLENSPLHSAAQNGHAALATMLIAAGADVNKPGRGGMRPLHMAARSGTVEIAQLLLDAGASANAVDARGKLAVDFAQANPRQAPVLALLSAATLAASPVEI